MARSCFSAACRVRNVPKFRRLPVLGFFLREYNRYLPDLSFRIMGRLRHNMQRLLEHFHDFLLLHVVANLCG